MAVATSSVAKNALPFSTRASLTNSFNLKNQIAARSLRTECSKQTLTVGSNLFSRPARSPMTMFAISKNVFLNVDLMIINNAKG
jgi:hypothetical protein